MGQPWPVPPISLILLIFYRLAHSPYLAQYTDSPTPYQPAHLLISTLSLYFTPLTHSLQSSHPLDCRFALIAQLVAYCLVYGFACSRLPCTTRPRSPTGSPCSYLVQPNAYTCSTLLIHAYRLHFLHRSYPRLRLHLSSMERA